MKAPLQLQSHLMEQHLQMVAQHRMVRIQSKQMRTMVKHLLPDKSHAIVCI